MYCPKCGWKNADNVAKCANCAADMQSPAPQQPQQTMLNQPQQYSQPNQQPYQQLYQQQYGQPATAIQPVPDYLIWSILVTLFCCLIPGIVAIVKSAQANSKKGIGDYYGALQDANAARTWLWWSFGLGLAGSLIYGVIIAIGVLNGTPH